MRDFAELESGPIPSGYLHNRDLGFSDERFDARDGFNPEYEGIRAREEALDVPFQLSLRDFLEEAITVYRRAEKEFRIRVDVRGPFEDVRFMYPVSAGYNIEKLLIVVAPYLGLPAGLPTDVLGRKIEFYHKTLARRNLYLGSTQTMRELGVTAEDNYIIAQLADTSQQGLSRRAYRGSHKGKGPRPARPTHREVQVSQNPTAQGPAKASPKPAVKRKGLKVYPTFYPADTGAPR
ncbi:hypothetical protein DFP72DRAFT_851485 [Ephemerocybe angulata]|uniref:Uncharacterized protein n=1 Tax=Ephemerocybe angulata TaxID=980116 RepID=A0A8H6HPB4_9AGAR|nr:hypothetical protein DFP72DRAFT_851485 [Tulosesus angulatus]